MGAATSHWTARLGLRANSIILTSIATVGVCTAVVKLAGLVKLSALASRFGTRDELDAFLIAFAAPAFIADSVGGAVSASLIPALVDVRERQGIRVARQLLSDATLVFGGFLMVLAGILQISGRHLMSVLAPGFSPAKLEMSVMLLGVLTPALVCGGLASMWRGVLTASGNFAIPALIPVLTPLAIVAALLLSGGTVGIRALAWGTLSGAALEAIAASLALAAIRMTPIPSWHGFSPALRRVLREYAPMMLATIVFGASALVDQSMAARAGGGGVSILNYGMRLTAFVTAMGPMVVSTAVFPHFAVMASRERWSELHISLKSVLGVLLLMSIPVTAGLIVFSEPLVRVLLHRGAFSVTDVYTVTAVQRLALLQLPFAILCAPMVRLLSSLKANADLLKLALVHLTATVLLDYVLVRLLGVRGIALATAAVSSIDFSCLAWLVVARVRSRQTERECEAPS